MKDPLLQSIFLLSPILILITTALFSLVIDLFWSKDKRFIFGLTCVGLVAAFIATLQIWMGENSSLFEEALQIDRYAMFFTLVSLAITFMVTLNSYSLIQENKVPAGEYLFFILSTCVGMSLMAWASDLITLFMSLEIMSLSVYILTGIQTENRRATEGAFKYFLLGAFSTGFLLYGISFIYASVGSTHYSQLTNFLVTSRYTIPIIFYVGVGLLIVGFSFKIAAVPFHMWVPDVYEAAHPTIAGFMATGVKAAAFAAFIRLFFVSFLSINTHWTPIAIGLCLLTMTVGNLAALMQMNIKRMLAYSSIAHAGYIFIALASTSGEILDLSLQAILFYVVAYALMTLGAFSIIHYASQKQERSSLSDYANFGFSHPYLGLAMTVFMLSLTGIPLTAGFIGKFYLFSSAIKGGLLGLAGVAILNSVMSAFYYLRVLIIFYMKPALQPPELSFSLPLSIVIAILAVSTLLLGLFPSGLLTFIQSTISSLY